MNAVEECADRKNTEVVPGTPFSTVRLVDGGLKPSADAGMSGEICLHNFPESWGEGCAVDDGEVGEAHGLFEPEPVPGVGVGFFWRRAVPFGAGMELADGVGKVAQDSGGKPVAGCSNRRVGFEIHGFRPPEEIHQARAADEGYGDELESGDGEVLVDSGTDSEHEPCGLAEGEAFHEPICVALVVELLDRYLGDRKNFIFSKPDELFDAKDVYLSVFGSGNYSITTHFSIKAMGDSPPGIRLLQHFH